MMNRRGFVLALDRANRRVSGRLLDGQEIPAATYVDVPPEVGDEALFFETAFGSWMCLGKNGETLLRSIDFPGHGEPSAVPSWGLDPVTGNFECHDATVRGTLRASAGPNLVANGDFETAISGWQGSAGAALVQDTVNTYAGTKSLKMTAPSSPALGTDYVETVDLLAIEPQFNYRLVVGKTISGGEQSADYLAVRWYDAAQAFISQIDGQLYGASDAAPAQSPVPQALLFEPPANAAFARVRVNLFHEAASQTLHVDGVSFTKMSRIIGGRAAVLLDESILRSRTTDSAIQQASATAADVDATNLVLTFVGPDSGEVLIELAGSSLAQNVAAATVNYFWLLREGSTEVSLSRVLVMQASQNQFAAARQCYRLRFKGLTPGTTYNWKWAHKLDTGGVGRNFYALHGPGYGALEMRAWTTD